MAMFLTVMLVRFAIIAVIVAVLGVLVFAIAVRLKRRGRWEQTRSRIAPVLNRAVEGYARRSRRDGRSGWTAELARGAAEKFGGRDR